MRKVQASALAGAVMMSGVAVLGAPVQAAGTFSGTVVDSDSAPIAGATVMLVDEEVPVAPISVLTDDDGNYAVADVPNGDWKVLVSHPAYAATFVGAQNYAAATTFIVDDGSAIDADATLLLASAALDGTVLDGAGNPVEAAFVSVSIDGPYIGNADADHFTRSVETDAQGRFLIEGMAPGSASIYIEAPEGQGLVSEFYNNVWADAAPTAVSLFENGTTSINDIVLDSGAEISGVVRDDAGNPVSGAIVVASGLNPVDATTGDDGSYRLFPVEPGLHSIMAITDSDAQGSYRSGLTTEVGASYGNIDITVATVGVPPVDVEPPTITCPAGAAFLLNDASAQLTADVTDNGSGVESPTVSVSAPTATMGLQKVSVSAADRAGNSATVECGYAVNVDLTRFRVGHHRSEVRAGSFVPVVWRVADARGRGVKDIAHLESLSVDDTDCVGKPVRRSKKEVGTQNDSGSRWGTEPVRLFGGVWLQILEMPKGKGCSVTINLSVVGDSASATVRTR